MFSLVEWIHGQEQVTVYGINANVRWFISAMDTPANDNAPCWYGGDDVA